MALHTDIDEMGIVHQAVRNVHDNIRVTSGRTLDDIVGLDEDDTPVTIDKTKAKTEYDRLYALEKAREYVKARGPLYPDLAEQFDLLWHAIDDGALDKTSDFYTKLKKVKDDNPKPS